MNAYIAHKLEHVLYFERDEEIRKEGGEVPNPFQTMLAKIEHRSSSETGEVCWLNFNFFFCVIKCQRLCSIIALLCFLVISNFTQEEESPSEEAASTCMKQSGPPREGVTNESCKKKKVTNFVRDRNESPESKKVWFCCIIFNFLDGILFAHFLKNRFIASCVCANNYLVWDFALYRSLQKRLYHSLYEPKNRTYGIQIFKK